MNTWNEAGKGRKQCPACKVYVGVRASKCKCGHIFGEQKATAKAQVTKSKKSKKKIKAAKETPPPEEVKERSNFFVVLSTPSKQCPVELASVSKKDVLEWATEIVEFHRNRNEMLRVEALKYYVRYFHPFYTDEAKNVYNIIDEIKDEVNLYV